MHALWLQDFVIVAHVALVVDLDEHVAITAFEEPTRGIVGGANDGGLVREPLVLAEIKVDQLLPARHFGDWSSDDDGVRIGQGGGDGPRSASTKLAFRRGDDAAAIGIGDGLRQREFAAGEHVEFHERVLVMLPGFFIFCGSGRTAAQQRQELLRSGEFAFTRCARVVNRGGKPPLVVSDAGGARGGKDGCYGDDRHQPQNDDSLCSHCCPAPGLTCDSQLLFTSLCKKTTQEMRGSCRLIFGGAKIGKGAGTPAPLSLLRLRDFRDKPAGRGP